MPVYIKGEDNIECIFNWAPSVKQWWITAFNPKDKTTRSEDMVVVGKIDFSGKESLYKGLQFRMKATEMKRFEDNIFFDEDGHTVWIIWDKEEENDTRNPITKAFDSTYGECLRFIAGLY